MADLPISGLPAASSLDGTELLPFVQGGVTTQATAQDILNADLSITSSGITLSGDIVPSTPQGATLGSVDKPFAELFIQSGSISIESDTPGDPSAIISNENGNLEISVGGMSLVESGSSFTSPTGSFEKLSAGLTENYVWLGDSSNRNTQVSLDTLADSGSLIKKSYGSFYDTTSQTASLADTIYAVNHNSTDLSNGVSIVSGSRITVSESGTYTIISTHQYVHNTGGVVTITGWLRKNGVDVDYSGTDLRLKGNGDKDLYAINYFVESEAGDYYELMWSANGTDTFIVATPARTGPVRPAVPSVITTVNRVG